MTSNSTCTKTKPAIGVLMLETTFPRIPGDVGNPGTFAFPVIYKTVRGASPQKVVIGADAELIENFISAGQALVSRGVKAITTSCGFLALFHRQLVDALPVPVFTSSLLQVHMAQAVIHKDQKVGIITARKQSLTEKHYRSVGIEHHPIAVIGMEDAEEFSAVFIEGKTTLDEAKCQNEMEIAAIKLKEKHPDIGAIVLECTNMPPYSFAIQRVTGLPVFDVVTMVNYAHSIVVAKQS